jgi:hypothetical protein
LVLVHSGLIPASQSHWRFLHESLSLLLPSVRLMFSVQQISAPGGARTYQIREHPPVMPGHTKSLHIPCARAYQICTPPKSVPEHTNSQQPPGGAGTYQISAHQPCDVRTCQTSARPGCARIYRISVRSRFMERLHRQASSASARRSSRHGFMQ